MSEREELQKLRRVKELQKKSSPIDSVNAFIADKMKATENPKAFANALQTAAYRVQELGNRLPGSSPEDSAKYTAERKRLEALPGGSGGVFLGDTVATLPFGLISKSVQGARALAGSSKIARALTSAPAAAASEGVAVGGILNDSPKEGAALGAALNLLGRGIGKTLTGPITKSAEAKSLQQVATAEGVPLSLPVGAAAKSPLVRKAFGDVLPTLPGAQRAMGQQKKELQGQLDNLADVRGVPQQSTASLLGADIRSPSALENRMAWALTGVTGTTPKVATISRLAASSPVNKALLGDYQIQQKAAKLGKKIKPITEALRRVLTLEGSENE